MIDERPVQPDLPEERRIESPWRHAYLAGRSDFLSDLTRAVEDGSAARIRGTQPGAGERWRVERVLDEIREAERNRISQELHDSVLQDIVYGLQEIQVLQVTSEDGGDPLLGDAAEALRRSVEGLRSAIYELGLGEMLDRSFVSSLESLLDLNRRMSRRRYDVELIVQGEFPRTLPEKTGRELLRIIQEALTNIRRHAEARHVLVTLGLDGGLISAEVADDGRGFDGASSRAGVGQRSMRQRALDIGGELAIHSKPGSGTRVRFAAFLTRSVED
ncbi:MAG: ATP-binding protein [Rubrobacter sp.]